MSDRLSCCIPGCRRTFKRQADDSDDVIIMCGRHWRMGDQRLLDRHKQLKRRVRWFERKIRFGHRIRFRPKFGAAHHRALYAAHLAWYRIRDDVTIKAALGAEDAPRKRRAA